MRMKYSSHEGRTRLSAACSSEVSTAGSLKRSIQPVPRVAKPRHDERVLIQLWVEGGSVEGHLGMLAGHSFDTRRSSHGVQAGNPARAVLLELGEGRGEAPAGGEHRI